ncbi:HdaA/DnaA family protein [Pontivivens insulae]|uniref:DnaA regulatory inactivator Hda n=1 Tax=Pontivivens insulae TaxID=1639689 RepID=A0A2R8ABQ1_9RHOB|nr:DnaA/Hda family protein [Pontivivens insulae]RED11172.1 DnaA regulatory inactivator Hda [Pontivivens insulae]SPF29654.1 DnaA regulatory inactivator Hda [Pontivivens insulae]
MSEDQFVLPLPVRTSRGRDAFFVSSSNAEALALIDNAAHWPSGKLALSGPKGSGKTHLVHLWAEAQPTAIISAADLAEEEVPGLAATGAVAVEDVDQMTGIEAERALFHLHNMLGAQGGRLLVTGEAVPSHWPIDTPDLGSRLTAATHVRLGAADDMLVQAVLLKIAEDRQMVLPPDVFSWLIARLPRALDEVARQMEALDLASLRDKRRLTIPYARSVLAL